MRGLGDDARSRLRNEKIGFIFQGFNLIPDLDLFDNVDVPLRYRGCRRAERRGRIEEALARVGLGSRMKHYPAELSGGQQQRVAIARALAGEPAPAARRRADRQPRFADGAQRARAARGDQRAGTTILMVTHDPELAARAQRNVHIVDGQVTDLVRASARAGAVAASDGRALSSSPCSPTTCELGAAATCAATRC